MARQTPSDTQSNRLRIPRLAIAARHFASAGAEEGATDGAGLRADGVADKRTAGRRRRRFGRSAPIGFRRDVRRCRSGGNVVGLVGISNSTGVRERVVGALFRSSLLCINKINNY